jgi:hypothetical protein
VQAKDGHPGQSSSGAPNRSQIVRAVVASSAIAAGVGAVFIARRAFSAISPRRKQNIPADITAAGIPLQQFTRWRATDGTHTIQAKLLAEFEPGERATTLHIAFCPPFQRLPHAEAKCVDDPRAKVSVTQRLHNGVQLEVRLPQPADEKQSVTIELAATDA